MPASGSEDLVVAAATASLPSHEVAAAEVVAQAEAADRHGLEASPIFLAVGMGA